MNLSANETSAIGLARAHNGITLTRFNIADPIEKLLLEPLMVSK
jgi:hypothetical protein